MKNLHKLELYERIKISYLRHLGNYHEVRQDFPDLTPEYIWDVVKKVRGQEDRDVNVKIANTIMREIYFGYYARIRMYVEMLAALKNSEFSLLSVCCRRPVRTETEVHYCMKCGHSTDIEVSDKLATFEAKRSLLVEWRNETEVLVNLAVKMKYTANANVDENQARTTYNVEQNIVMLDGAKKTLEKIHEQSPADRERVIQSIENELKAISYQVAEMDVKEGGSNGQPRQ